MSNASMQQPLPNSAQTAELNEGKSFISRGIVKLLLIAVLIIAPFFANSFVQVQIGAQTFVYGIIALGLTFLAGSGGMVSLSQISIAGLAGYAMAIFGENSIDVLGFGWAWPVVVMVALSLAVIFGVIIGALAVRTEGIYTIMITLAITTCFFYFTRQNYAVFNGFTGYSGIKAPVIAGVNLRDPMVFYFLTLVLAIGCYSALNYLTRSTYGIAIQGIRDNPRRMASLGFSVKTYRISAYAIAASFAGIGGVLTVWMNDRIDPASIGVGPAINILVITVIGGLKHPIGAFIGALLFVLLDNFAVDLIDRERFNTLIGAVFLVIVLFSKDGMIGFWERFRTRKK